MDSTTLRLAEFALQADYTALSPDTIHECKRRIVDTMACAIGAYNEPVCRMARVTAERSAPRAGTAACSVWGSSVSTTPEAAAFANGVMLRFLDLNDMYRVKSGGHPSDLMAAVIAVGEAIHADGASVINAITLAYDVYCGFCRSVDANSRGWDCPLWSGVASVLGAGRLLGLNREQLAQAIALTVVPNMALLQTRTGELSSWKGCAAAYASRNAVFAVFLALDGFTGPTAPFEGKHGLWDIIGRFDWELPAAGMPHLVAETHMKCFPVCYHCQAPIGLALDLREQVEVESIADIEIETYGVSFRQVAADPSRWAPATRETADHSMPYGVAVALLDGEVTPQSFADQRLVDLAIAELMHKIRVRENPALSAQYPTAVPCRFATRLKTGQIVVTACEYPKGHASVPLHDRTLDTKFRGMFRTYGSQAQCEAALDRLWRFEQVKDMAEVLKLFAFAAE